MQVLNHLTSKYDGENLRGNGLKIEHGGQVFIYQYFDLGMRLTTEDGWCLAYATDPLVVWRCEDRPGLPEVRRPATQAEIEIARMAQSGELKHLVKAQKSEQIIDRTPWQKGDDYEF